MISEMSNMPKAPLGASLVVLSSVFYASYGIWTTLMGDFFEGYTASALRSVLVLLILLPIAWVLRSFQPLDLKRNWRWLLAMLFSSMFTWGPLYYAIQHAGIGMSLAVAYASIVIGAFFFGWLCGGERFTRSKAVSAGLGIIGLGLIFSPTTSGLIWLALIGATVSGLSAGANTVFAKQIHYNATQSTVVLWVASVIGNFVMAFVMSESRPAIEFHAAWLYLVIFAIASVIASWSVVRGVKLIDAGAAGVLGLLEIVFGVLFGVVLFHEQPTVIVLAGVVVIIMAAAIPYFKDFNMRRGTIS